LPISAIDAIGPAVQHTRQQLFQPFRMGQWARIALVGLLAGELTSGSCNFNFQTPRHTDQFIAPRFPAVDPAVLGALVLFLIGLAVVLYGLFLFVNSVMRFILFDSVIAKRCEIRQGWSRRQEPGFRYFLWQLVFFLTTLVAVTILIGIPAALALAAGWFTHPKDHLAGLILCGMLLFFVALAGALVWLAVYVLTKDFVIPQMAVENLSAFQAWGRLLPMLNGEKGPYVGYLAMKAVMAIGVAVVVGVIATLVILVMLIPVGGIGAVVVLAGKAAGLQWNLYTITVAVIAGCMVLAVILYVISLISAPAIVFFPAYAIYFFASRYPALDALLHPAPVSAGNPPPPEPQGTG